MNTEGIKAAFRHAHSEIIERGARVAPDEYNDFVEDMISRFVEKIAPKPDWEALAEEYRQKWIAASNALYHFRYPIDPSVLRNVADRIDCGGDCETVWREWDTNASGCTLEDSEEGCPYTFALELRALADSIDVAHASKITADGSGGLVAFPKPSRWRRFLAWLREPFP